MDPNTDPKDDHKAERRLTEAKTTLMRTSKFALWSGILMVGTSKVVDDIPTACTNGRDELYGRRFISCLTRKEIAFVVLHETLHKAFRHISTWQKLAKEDMELCNKACDYVINLLLTDNDPSEDYIVMPTLNGQAIGCVDRRFAGMHTKQVFDILKKEKQEKEGQSGGGSGGKGQPGSGQPGQGEPKPGEPGGGFDDHDWTGAEELSEKEKEQLVRDVDAALRQGQLAHAKKMGDGGGGMLRAVQDILKPEVDWKALLREFVMSQCAGRDMSSWRRPNRRFLHQGVYMPTLISEKIGSIVLGVDTSGSISSELPRFFSEMDAIFRTLNPEKVDLIYWDACVAGVEMYGDGGAPLETFLQTTKPVGGGGTDPRCMLEYMKREDIKPQCIIMFTDGEVPSWGDDWPAPILWVVVNEYRGESITATCGKTIHVKELGN